MLFTTATFLALSASVSAVKTSRTFAVLHFYGDVLTTGRADPIISPGEQSGHVHTIQGGSNFGLTMGDDTLLSSTCTSGLIKGDKSNYWVPSLYFQHSNGTFESVPLFYNNVYYFFEATDDEIVAFPPGLRMVVGNPNLRTPPVNGYNNQLDPADGPIQPVQWTCPRTTFDPPSWPADSDGLHGVGIGSGGAGAGFPDQNCDGYASPLRADIHFPSCYNPAAGLDDYKNNMAFPSSNGTASGRANCPEGWIHTPHIFYEFYWNTPLFKDLWTPGQNSQPFVLANGDPTGYSLHADFISGWDTDVLQQIIDNCDAGDSGMDKCPGLLGGVNDPSTSCDIPLPLPAGVSVEEQVSGLLSKLPGNNPIVGWGGTVGSASSATSAAAGVASAASSVLAAGSSVVAAASSAVATASIAATNNVNEDDAVVATTPAATQAANAVSTTIEAEATTTTELSDGTDIVITIYQTVTETAPASSTTVSNVNGYNYLGCYSDQLNIRALQGQEFVDLGVGKVTTAGCITHCEAAGFTLAGTEYGGQCFCGNSLISSSVISASHCNMSCEGDRSQTCGGSLALSVFEKPGAKRRRHIHRHVGSHHF